MRGIGSNWRGMRSRLKQQELALKAIYGLLVTLTASILLIAAVPAESPSATVVAPSPADCDHCEERAFIQLNPNCDCTLALSGISSGGTDCELTQPGDLCTPEQNCFYSAGATQPGCGLQQVQEVNLIAICGDDMPGTDSWTAPCLGSTSGNHRVTLECSSCSGFSR